jgi:hypothetical protein
LGDPALHEDQIVVAEGLVEMRPGLGEGRPDALLLYDRVGDAPLAQAVARPISKKRK